MTPAGIAVGVFASAAALAGGVALGVTGALDVVAEDPDVVLAADEVPLHVCPGADEVGTLVRGDHVLAVAQDDGGEWLQVRSPTDLFDRVWVRAEFLISKGSTADLPAVDCSGRDVAVDDEIAAPEETTTSTPDETTTTSESTTTTTLVDTTTTAPPSEPTSTTRDTTTTTTVANQAPTIGQATASPEGIWEMSATGCSTGRPTTTVLAAEITDDGHVASVEFVAAVNGQTQTLPQAEPQGSTHRAQLGPFNSSTVSADTDVHVTITATDNVGETASTVVTVRLVNC
ncbi:MAG: hypothetical protein OSA99_02055 [Acidimicrobiales bacterium]|nr:hypothetical protein [Acidimicrobiales bacterium]